MNEDEQYLSDLLENIFERSRTNMENDNYLGLDELKHMDNEFGYKISKMTLDTID